MINIIETRKSHTVNLKGGNKVNKEFQVHRLNEHGINLAKDIASIFDSALDQLSTYCSAGREWSIVKTKMEEACFFAKKAMANNVLNQVEEKQ